MTIGAYAAPRIGDGASEVDQVVSEMASLGITEIYLLAIQCSVGE